MTPPQPSSVAGSLLSERELAAIRERLDRQLIGDPIRESYLVDVPRLLAHIEQLERALKETQTLLLEANWLVTRQNIGRQDAFLNRIENLLDAAGLAALTLTPVTPGKGES
jgi:hypothetical protein